MELAANSQDSHIFLVVLTVIPYGLPAAGPIKAMSTRATTLVIARSCMIEMMGGPAD